MAEPTSSDSFDRLTKRIGVIGGLIAALVGLNTLVTSCSREQSQRYADFRAAANAEEANWRALYGDYIAAFHQSVEDDDRRKRLFAIEVLSRRDPPDFHEFRLGLLRDDPEAKRAAIERIRAMKAGLRAAITNPDASDPQVVKAVAQNQSDRTADATAIRPRQGAAADRAQAVVQQAARVPPSVTPVAATQVLAAGSRTGWDLDLFWCASRDPVIERQNYSIALDRGRLLAQRANARTAIAPGVILGRIRLRVLPTSRQGPQASGFVYPVAGDGLQVRYEDKASSNREERTAGQAVLRLLNDRASGFSFFPSEQPTPFYMSLFVCTGTSAAPAAAA